MGLPDNSDRGQWGSRLGFILAASGSAVGLGNIWRFPYVTGENGGAAFVVVYLACVFFIGLPLLLNELALGRASQRNPIGAFLATGGRTPFVLAGVLSLVLCFVVLSYYGVIAGWTIGYAIATLAGKTLVFGEFAANPALVIPLFAVFIGLTTLIIQGGVEKGIERWTKLLMPLLLVLVLVIIARSLMLPGAMKGVEYYLKPDFSKITGKTFLMALGQAFFSLSVGWGLMITYGSYMKKTQSIASGGFWVALMDTGVALLGGFMVFPAVFAFGKDVAAGPALTFVTLPEVFSEMPLGMPIGVVFFFLLTVAALTSSISMMEVPVSYFVDEKGASRKKAAWIVGVLAFLFGLPSALSQGGSKLFSEMTLKLGSIEKTGFLDIMDFIFGTVLVVVISLLCSLYVGWVWKARKAVAEIEEGAPGFAPFAGVWSFFIKVVCPAIMLINLYFLLFPGKD
ncbi:MAG: sodium-dependent transporter [Verrucomicrobiota bacterium]